ncbi:ATP-binding protein [Cellulomonas sp. APG4]|uniref:ATP-binding protein n=1 Tax=Cellulomonas sp. APG4 TaxID=1538656 RepID=UPI0013794E2D|nr:ATP-binding protein [Cellulomonas sp. APG4]
MTEILLEPRLGELARARHWARDLAARAGAPRQRLQVVELLTSEAVANALHHGPTSPVRVAARVHDGRLTIRVADDGDALPVVRTTGPEVPGGHGMRIIDRLAERWGVEPRPTGGKTVWFTVALDA